MRDAARVPGRQRAAASTTRTPSPAGNYGLTPARPGVARSARHRPEPAGDGLLQASIRRRTIPASTASTSWAIASPRRSRTRSTPTSAASTTGMPSNHTLFGRFNVQDDAVVERAAVRRAAAPNTTRKVKSRGFASGWDAVLSSSMVNTFRYGLTQIKRGHRRPRARRPGGLPQHRPILGATDRLQRRDIPTHSFVDDVSWVKGAHTLKFGGSLRFSRVGTTNNSNSFHIPAGERLLGGWRRHDLHARRICPDATAAACDVVPGGRPRRRLDLRRHVHSAARRHLRVDAYYNYDRDGNVLPLGRARRRGALPPTSTSSTRRTAGRSGRT